ncbi:MAG: flavodoxin domain-containing protein [Candidatus Hodarchaeota archaeon]
MYSILVVYANRYGSTAEIAQEIAETLEKNEMEVELIDLKDSVKIPSLDYYDGILVGTGIRMGRWIKEALKFLKQKREILRNKFLGIFISSVEAANPNTYEMAKQKYIEKILLKTSINSDRVMKEAFGGIFDFSMNSNYNYIEKKILQRIAQTRDDGFIVHDGKLNDFRNWQRIRNWATDFSNLIKSNNS